MRALVDEPNPKSSYSLFALIKELPSLLMNLLKAELAQLKAELTQKAIRAGVGVGLFLGAAFFAFFAFATGIAAAVLGIAVALPGWLAALIVMAALFVIAIILALVGLSSLKKAMPPMPEKTIASVKEDVNAIKGMGRYER